MKFEMSAKASPPTTTVKIKKEIANDEIKDFAETAMNELLGWYGYDNVDRIELSAKTSRLLNSNNAVDPCNRSEVNGSRISQRDDSTISDRDSSREDSKSPSSTKLGDRNETNCGWCRRLVPENSPKFLTTPDGPRYCSESCFAQSRRASFKRAKTCDWCRHVRHAVSYVDFQDGASQLQFCSDKCLNQYKMQIFCKETQAHLDMNPHLKEKGNENSGGGLITPELWLKNCRSRSASPTSEPSRSSTPTQGSSSVQKPLPHKPLISVAPVSKLMSKSGASSIIKQSPKHSRKRRTTRTSQSQISNVNCVGVNHGSSHSGKSKILVNALAAGPNVHKPCTYGTVQDLRLNVPSMSPVEGSHSSRPSIPPSFFSPSSNSFPIRPPFLGTHHQPRLMGQQLPPLMPPDLPGLGLGLGTVPPVTVMVPYPIIVPLPIPIPIPLPITAFLKAALSKTNETPEDRDERDLIKEKEDPPSTPNDLEEPLDFTKSKATSSCENPVDKEKREDPAKEPLQADENFDDDDDDESSEKRKFPKFKITRMHTKRLITKESENSRPLRKRKRIIDCDYLRSSKDEDDNSKHKK